MAATLSIVERDAPEAAPVDVRNAVVPRQPFVDERVVSGQQLGYAVILTDLAVEEERQLTRKRLAQVLVEIRKE